MKGIIWSPKTLYWACTIICIPKMNIMMPLTWTCGATRHARDTIASRRRVGTVIIM